MCKPTHKHFICVCPHRNHPTCSHHVYVRNHAEYIAMDEPNLTVEGGWYLRLPSSGQSCRAWQPYAEEWEHCIYYKLKHRDERTGEVIPGQELCCSENKQWGVRPIIKHETGVCTGCAGCEEAARTAAEEKKATEEERRKCRKSAFLKLK
ncbi:hypothetical protein QBC42DRAFT_284805 [Cladorrhinum samala]|uniref:Uncharacterized protein n=1 Tax=Cladorrhinum samala TaxID=585594 RepID=A0AAV9HVF4_9PEZI|nr:hypothetical protein QBC42DRAFT_284805 [Cladorrhinum samala]